MTDNDRAVKGDNADAIDYAKEETQRLQRDYAELGNTAERLAEEAGAIPADIPDAAVKEAVVDLIKRIRDAKVRIEGLHSLEKQPHLRRGQGVDNFFFGLWGFLSKRNRNDRDGIGDELQKKLTAYDVKVLAAETERRRLIAEEAERVAAAAERERLRLFQAAEEARLAAERARKPETTAAKVGIAQEAEAEASAATVEAASTASAAEVAYVETLARPANIMRTRTGAGTLSTMQQETYAEIEKVDLLDPVKLWAHVSYADKEKALRAWAKATDHREAMPGARVGRRPKSTVR